MAEQSDFLNLHETSALLRISEGTLRRMIKRGTLNAYRVGNHPNGGAFRIRRQDAYSALKTV